MISNSRIVDVSERKVFYKYKNYKSGKLDDLMALDVSLFLRRYSHHICDRKFQCVRHGGIYGSRVKQENAMDARLKVYGDWKKTVRVLKEVWKIENNIAQKIDSVSICSLCNSQFELENIQDSA